MTPSRGTVSSPTREAEEEESASVLVGLGAAGLLASGLTTKMGDLRVGFARRGEKLGGLRVENKGGIG